MCYIYNECKIKIKGAKKGKYIFESFIWSNLQIFLNEKLPNICTSDEATRLS